MSGPAAPVRPGRRARRRARLAAAGVAVALAVAGCSSGDDAVSTEARAPAASDGSGATTTTSGGAAGDEPRALPPAPALPDVPAPGPEPTALTIDSIDVAGAPVRPVGVEEDGEMEIPGATEVGWYRFGARPGDAGSAVLAAHIAYDGVDGVFRRLADVAPGDAVQVNRSDGSAVDYVVSDVTQVPKAELPDDVWARDGDARLVLITCGGEFDRAAGRYRDNVVATARPA